MSRHNTRAGAFESARKTCLEMFAKHELVKEGEGRWLCRKLGDSAFHFRVITAPYHVIVVGDIGENILFVSDREPLPWLRSFADKTERDGYSHDYMVSKIVNKQDEFYAGDAFANLEERIKELDESDSKHAEEYKDFRESVSASDSEQDWIDAYRNSDIDYESVIEGAYGPPIWSYLTAECLCWFAKALVASERKQSIETVMSPLRVD